MKKKKKQKNFKLPIWANLFFTTVSLLYLKIIYRFKAHRQVLKAHKGGCLLFYTHYSNKDHYVIKASTGYRRCTYVLASSFFLNKTLNVVLKLSRSISKDQFKPDISAIRNMKNTLEQNQVVVIAPAGQTTIDGNSPFIARSVVKFIRMCKVDVLALQTRGVYLTFPKWRNKKSKRKCPMETNFLTILSKEELPNLTDDEIYERVCKALDVREYEDQLKMQRKIKSKNNIWGLENVIIKCPKCGKLHSFSYHDGKIICDECHLEIGMDQYGFLTSNDESFKFTMLPELYDWQRTEFGKDYLNGKVFQTKAKLLSNMFNQKEFEEIGEGLVTLSKDEFKYQITIDGEDKVFTFNQESITQLPFDPGRRFEIPNEECIFRLYPENVKAVMDYVLVIDYLNNEREKSLSCK